jgi:hypothetical protein
LSYCSLTLCLQYWVTYAFLTVVESAINAVYWFPFYYVFKFVLVLWMALPQTGYGRSILYSLTTPCTDNLQQWCPDHLPLSPSAALRALLREQYDIHLQQPSGQG